MDDLVGFGARVHTCSRNEIELNKCLTEWSSLGLEVTGSVCDVSVRSERVNLIESLSSLFQGKLSILVSSLFSAFNIYVHVLFVCLPMRATEIVRDVLNLR